MNKQKDYWEKATPMTFGPEKWTYEQKRKFRYELQDYQLDTYFSKYDFQDKQVLEFGCGAGIDSVEFARRGAQVISCDITWNAVKSTSELAKEAMLSAYVLAVMVEEKPPYKNLPSEYFDFVYSFGVLHHIKDVYLTLNELVRILKPGGILMGMVYNRDSLLFSHSILERWWHESNGQSSEDIAMASAYSERIENAPYTRCYTKGEVETLLSRTLNMKDVKVEVKYNVIDTPNQRKVKYTLDPPDNDLGWHLCFEATKG